MIIEEVVASPRHDVKLDAARNRLTRIAICNYKSLVSVTRTRPPSTPDPADPTIAVVERQLAMLGALARMTIEVAQGYAAAALAESMAVEVILADEYYQPETGRARALAGSKDAAEAFRKVSRSLRLTLALELTTAETLRDLRAGIVREPRPTASASLQFAIEHTVGGPDAPRPEAERGDRAADVDRIGSDSERLVEFDRPDRLPSGAFRDVVGHLCADIGAAPDWDTWTVSWPELKYRSMNVRPVGWETRPPGSYPPEAVCRAADQEAALSP